MAEMAEEKRARGRGMWALIVLGLVAAFLAVLFAIGYFNNEINKRGSGDNTRSPISANENR